MWHSVACYNYVRRLPKVLFNAKKVMFGGFSRGGHLAVSLASRTSYATHAMATHRYEISNALLDVTYYLTCPSCHSIVCQCRLDAVARDPLFDDTSGRALHVNDSMWGAQLLQTRSDGLKSCSYLRFDW